MIEDFRTCPAGAVLEADVGVVGAGPTGLAFALALAARRPGLRITLVDSGGAALEPGPQALNAGVESIGLPHLGAAPVGRGRAFGGTGRLWAGQCLPLDPIDYAERAWVPHSGWPLDPAALAPFVARAEDFFRIPGAEYGDANYHRFRQPPPGWSPEALATVFTVYTPKVDTGADRLAEFRRHPGIRTLLHVTATRIGTDAAGRRAEAIHLAGPDGRQAVLRAPAIVLAAGGLENARLLLLSAEAKPRGLGNDRDLVGRFFQEHPTGITATLDPAECPDPAALQDRFRLFYGRDGRRYFPKFALSETVQRRAEVLNCNAHLVFDHPEESALSDLRAFVHAARRRRLPEAALRRGGRILAGLPEVAATAVRRYRHGLSPRGRPSAIRLQCYLEQAPNPASRIRLSPDRRDALGLPAMQVDWQMTPLELQTLRVMTATVAAEFDRLRLGRLRAADWLDAPGADWQARLADCYHHIGTTRMAATPERGVVDADCAVFGTAGLYVAGSSVFPTSGYANPTLAMVALGIRLADHIAGA